MHGTPVPMPAPVPPPSAPLTGLSGPVLPSPGTHGGRPVLADPVPPGAPVGGRAAFDQLSAMHLERAQPVVPGAQAQPSDPAGQDLEPTGRGRRLRVVKLVAAVLLVAVMVGAAGALWTRGGIDVARVLGLSEQGGGSPAVVKAPAGSPKVAAESGAPSARVAVAEPAPAMSQSATPPSEPPAPAATNPGLPPPAAATPSAGVPRDARALEAEWQQQPLWQLLKRAYPDWYSQRLGEAAKSTGDELAVATASTQAIVKLRREVAGSALASSPERMRKIAATFVDNLVRLARHSTDACFAYISGGDVHPLVVELARTPELGPPLQGLLLATFEAALDGRTKPRTHGAAQREDFDELASHLQKRGWTPADLQLFSDARALSRAPPQRVCKMVADWFAAQLDVKDEARQMRLLVETLKPIVAG